MTGGGRLRRHHWIWRRRRGLALAVVALTAGVVVAACGVPTDGSARQIAPEEVPFGLLEVRPTEPPDTGTSAAPTSEPPTTVAEPTTTTTPPPPAIALRVFFVLNEGVVGVDRPVTADPSVGDALALLDAGPTETESGAGLRSALVEPGLVVPVGVSRGTATLELDPRFQELPGSEQTLALAQIVFTVTDVAGVGSVQFQLAGVPLDVPKADGQVVSGPVSRDDYGELLATP